uniref:cytochrome c oxidase subunit III n=1 Tax=Changbaninus pleiospicules TaxID=2914790 RepID=UPI001EF9CD08|nr:cytochrome c oxidase subunit III [Changbaninus pleiospicules]UKE80318.1 cytochrome c oxidase subunit III [Changbaninus pleiospicules]
MKNHPFHLVDNSPWPLTGSMGLMSMTSGTTLWFHLNETWLMNLGVLIIMLTMIQWWRDVIRESTFQGIHTKSVVTGMKWGMILFITSEVLFFSSFFWAFFHSSLSPSMEIGMQWPPMGIKPFNPMSIPMLNTMILLSSGISITWAHNSLVNNNFSQTMQSLIITVLLGIYFTFLQAVEYYEAPFSMADSVYGSTFFMATGFHGLHVMIGTIFILISTLRILKLHMSKNHHVGFEASAWYWHFVDVVWLFLYISIYWWGS